MQKSNRVFVDGMSSVKLMDGVVRMEFFNNLGTTREPQPQPCGEIVMSQQAFLRAYNAMEDLMRQLVQAGIVKRHTLHHWDSVITIKSYFNHALVIQINISDVRISLLEIRVFINPAFR